MRMVSSVVLMLMLVSCASVAMTEEDLAYTLCDHNELQWREMSDMRSDLVFHSETLSLYGLDNASLKVEDVIKQVEGKLKNLETEYKTLQCDKLYRW